MKKNVIIYGLISGLILTAFLIYTITACYKNENFQGSLIVGYAAMLAALITIFIAIKKIRDQEYDGIISFGKAFTIGLYITLVASTIYVVVWLIGYYLFVPDFMDKYTAHELNGLKRDHATEAEIQRKTAEMAGYKEMYKNPAYIVLFTYLEVLPIGLLVSLVSAWILKKKALSSSAF